MLAHPNDVAPAQAWVIHTRPDSQACGCTPWQTPANAWPIFYAQELYLAVPVGDSQMRHSGFRRSQYDRGQFSDAESRLLGLVA